MLFVWAFAYIKSSTRVNSKSENYLRESPFCSISRETRSKLRQKNENFCWKELYFLKNTETIMLIVDADDDNDICSVFLFGYMWRLLIVLTPTLHLAIYRSCSSPHTSAIFSFWMKGQYTPSAGSVVGNTWTGRHLRYRCLQFHPSQILTA